MYVEQIYGTHESHYLIPAKTTNKAIMCIAKDLYKYSSKFKMLFITYLLELLGGEFNRTDFS